MSQSLLELFAEVPPVTQDGSKEIYSVVKIAGFDRFYLGKGTQREPCLLISVEASRQRRPARIKLENLDVQFGIRSTIQVLGESSEGVFTIIKCRAKEPDVIRYFISLLESIIRLLGENPGDQEIANVINTLAVIFQSLQQPAMRSVYGLVGELFVIRESRNPLTCLRAWRAQGSSRFDFAIGNVRLDAKATAGRVRVHSLSYDQCNPPPGTIGALASIFLERMDAGESLSSMVQEIENAVSAEPSLVLKLRELVAQTLGASLSESMHLRFDLDLARTSLRFFELRTIPAIRGDLPSGVIDVHFKTDLSGTPSISLAELRTRDAALYELLPPWRSH